MWGVSLLRRTVIVILTLSALAAAERVPLVVMTDIGGDPDDEQSMVRLLLYSDELDLRSIGVTSRLRHGQDTRPDLVHRMIDAYALVHPNLRQHSSSYPKPEHLRGLVKKGLGDPKPLGETFDTESSVHLIQVVDTANQPVHVAVWGGLRELAQALWQVRKSRRPAEVEAFCRKLRVYAIADQDGHRTWIIDNFKTLEFVASGFTVLNKSSIRDLSAFRGMYMTGDQTLQQRDWVKEHVHGHGPLADLYPLDAAGSNGLKEGDTPSFLGLVRNGLNVAENPEWGGWGGRFRRVNHPDFIPVNARWRPPQSSYLIDAPDFLNGTLKEPHSVSRWRPAFQREFMTRLDRCVLPPDAVNRPPVVIVNGHDGTAPLNLSIRTGKDLVLDARATRDPDKHRVSFQWFFYDELSDARGVRLEVAPGGAQCRVTFPAAFIGRTLHLILEVSDDGVPSLTRYKRVVIQVK